MAIVDVLGYRRLGWVAAVFFAGSIPFSPAAIAGSFSISPVRVYMSPKDKAVAVTVTNEGETELVMQADLFRWTQKPDGSDELTPTEDVLLTPPIIKLAPKARQVVRLVRLAPPDFEKQVTYRMIAKEVPEAIRDPAAPVVQFAFAFSIPVFITPPGAKVVFECAIERNPAKALVAACSNVGLTHVHMARLSLAAGTEDPAAESDALGYILPGATRRFELKPKTGALREGPAKLSVTFADGSTHVLDVAIPN